MRCRFMTLPGFLTRCLIVAGAVAVGQVAYCATSQADTPPPNPVCAEWSKIRDKLAEKYKEAPIGRGLVNDGSLVEVYTTEDGETWTIVTTTPAGMSCVIGAGKNWQALEALKGDLA